MRGLFLGLLALIVITGTFAPPTFCTETIKIQPIVDKTRGINRDIITINEPDVRRPKETINYSFQQFDTVSIEAGGCVQTGGAGSTWKRYVNPTGDNSDHLYYGTISIPTYPPDTPIKSYIVKRLRIREMPASTTADQRKLVIGYIDDNYGDNGYYNHDDGTQDQCKGIGNAWLRVTVDHHPQQPPLERPQAALDLWWDSVDDNLIPLNPQWGYQVWHPDSVVDAGSWCDHFHDEGDLLRLGNPPCTSWQPRVDEPSFFSDAFYYATCQIGNGFKGSVHGHVNWAVTTYQGNIYFSDCETPHPPFDEDYDFYLVGSSKAGLTVGNTWKYRDVGLPGMVLELFSNETIDRFNSPWWNAFHTAVDHSGGDLNFPTQRNWTAAQQMIDGKKAVVIGMLGVDNIHDAHAELHPVYGLAIHVKEDPCDDTWVVMARNWGTEGSCSQENHFLPSLGALTFHLTTDSLGTAWEATDATQFHSTHMSLFAPPWQSKWGLSSIPSSEGGGVLLTFSLADPNTIPMVDGELHLRSSTCRKAVKTADFRATLYKPGQHKALTLEEFTSLNPISEEGDLAKLTPYLSPDQQEHFYNALQNHQDTFYAHPEFSEQAAVRDDTLVTHKARSLGPNEMHTLVVIPQQTPDSELARRHRADFMALKDALGGEDKTNKLLKEIIDKSQSPPPGQPAPQAPPPPVHFPPLSVLGHLGAVNGILGMTLVPEGDSLPVGAFDWVGTMDTGRRMEGFVISFPKPVPGLSLEYMAHLEGTGDVPWVPAGQYVGTRGQSRRMEGFAIRLTGAAAPDYQVFYECHISGVGTSDLKIGGEFCGTRGQSRASEALSVWVERKD